MSKSNDDMMKFLCQTIGGRVTLDFVFALERAVEYHKWKGDEMELAYCELGQLDKLDFGIDSDAIRDYAPVGTLEFVFSFCRLYINPSADGIIRPINVPDELRNIEWRGVKTLNLTLGGDKSWDEIRVEHFADEFNVFIKSNEKIKSEYNGMYSVNDSARIDSLPEGSYQASSEIPTIDAEYRCFVNKDELLGIQWYSGDFTVFPDVSQIKLFMNLYCHDMGHGVAPQSYTLDVYVSKGKTYVMEVHDFFSCGLYGFDDYEHYPFMLYRTFIKIKRMLIDNIDR